MTDEELLKKIEKEVDQIITRECKVNDNKDCCFKVDEKALINLLRKYDLGE